MQSTKPSNNHISYKMQSTKHNNNHISDEIQSTKHNNNHISDEIQSTKHNNNLLQWIQVCFRSYGYICSWWFNLSDLVSFMAFHKRLEVLKCCTDVVIHYNYITNATTVLIKKNNYSWHNRCVSTRVSVSKN